MNISILALIRFWMRHPALLYGTAFMLGIYCQILGLFWVFVPCLFLWLPFLWMGSDSFHREYIKPLCLSAAAFLTAMIYTASLYSIPTFPPQGLSGMAHVSIKSIGMQSHFFGKRWLYRCEIALPSGAASLPCLISLPISEKKEPTRPLADKDYWVFGKLVRTEKNSYLFRVSSNASWIAIGDTWSRAEMRYSWKKRVSSWIKSKFSHPPAADFLAGLATGEFDDYWMRQQFSTLGLQHLLAISGFHFALIAGFLSFIFSLFLPRKIRCIALLFSLSAYAFFLGPQASILRAWMMCSLALIAGLIEKPVPALNSLGTALLASLGYEPLLCLELGFQLSFATTAAILLFHSPSKNWFYSLFPRRSLKEALEMNMLNGHAYCALSFLRQGLALSLSVTLFALPMTLYYFQEWPLLGFFYNLFFPLLASVSLCLLLVASAFSWASFLSDAIHTLNDHYTQFILEMTSQIPMALDTYLRVETFSAHWLTTYLCLASLVGMIWHERSRSDEKEPFQFI